MRGPPPTSCGMKANEYKKTEELDRLFGGPGTDHPPAAQLHQRLAVSGLEPVLQHLRRVRRLSRPLLLGDEGHQLHHRRHQATTRTSRGCCTTWAGSSPRRSAGPTKTCNIANCSSEDDDSSTSSRKPADRDNWLVGREWYLKAQDVVDKTGDAGQGNHAPGLSFLSLDVADRLRRGRSRKKEPSAKWPRTPGARPRPMLAEIRRTRHAHDLSTSRSI